MNTICVAGVRPVLSALPLRSKMAAAAVTLSRPADGVVVDDTARVITPASSCAASVAAVTTTVGVLAAQAVAQLVVTGTFAAANADRGSENVKVTLNLFLPPARA